MYIENNIAYAGEKQKDIKVVKVIPCDNYVLHVFFSNGIEKHFDFSKLLDIGVFKELQDKNVFSNVSIDYGVPVWKNGEIDIAPETLFENGY